MHLCLTQAPHKNHVYSLFHSHVQDYKRKVKATERLLLALTHTFSFNKCLKNGFQSQLFKLHLYRICLFFLFVNNFVVSVDNIFSAFRGFASTSIAFSTL